MWSNNQCSETDLMLLWRCREFIQNISDKYCSGNLVIETLIHFPHYILFFSDDLVSLLPSTDRYCFHDTAPPESDVEQQTREKQE